MKKAIKGMLDNIVGEDLGKQIFEANFPKPIDGYMPGKVLTFGELKALPEGTIIHILYLDEDGEEREDGFHPLGKDDKGEEWNAGGSFPFPVDELKDGDLIEGIDNSDWSFTIREAVPAKKGEFEKSKREMQKAQDILETMQDLFEESRLCKDKERQKEIKKKSKELEKQLRKITGI